MKDYVIFVDAGCDLSPEWVKKLGIGYIPLEVKFDDEEFSRSSDTIDPQELYQKLRNGSVAKTAAANADRIAKNIAPVLASGKDVLYIAFSSGLSSTFSSAKIAADELANQYHERKIRVVDSLAASLGYGLLVYKAVELKNKGSDIDAVADWVEDSKLNLCHWFTVDDLIFLKRGGRVSAATAVVGSLLGIKPVLHVDDNGCLINISKVRGRKASIQALVDMMKKSAYKNTDDDVFISHGDCSEDAKLLEDMVRKQLGFHNIKTGIIGPTIGAHSGPGTLALFFLGNKR